MAKKVWLLAIDYQLSAEIGVQFFPCPVRGDGNGNPEEQLPVASSQPPAAFADDRRLTTDDRLEGCRLTRSLFG
jgi:hypothetical protein